MRGTTIYEGLSFTATKMEKNDNPPVGRLHCRNEPRISLIGAGEFDFWNQREVELSSLVVSNSIVDVGARLGRPNRRMLGSFGGHVPQTDLNRVTRRQKLNDLRKGVAPQC